jgi:hypothetical protein
MSTAQLFTPTVSTSIHPVHQYSYAPKYKYRCPPYSSSPDLSIHHSHPPNSIALNSIFSTALETTPTTAYRTISKALTPTISRNLLHQLAYSWWPNLHPALSFVVYLFTSHNFSQHSDKPSRLLLNQNKKFGQGTSQYFRVFLNELIFMFS